MGHILRVCVQLSPRSLSPSLMSYVEPSTQRICSISDLDAHTCNYLKILRGKKKVVTPLSITDFISPKQPTAPFLEDSLDALHYKAFGEVSKFPLPVSHCRCTVFCVPQPCSGSSWPCRIQPALDPESSILVFDQAPFHFSLPCSPRPMVLLNTANNLNYNLANFKVLNSHLKEYKGVFLSLPCRKLHMWH